MRTPSPLPAPALWAEPHRRGWAKGRALCLEPCASAARPGARGRLGRGVPSGVAEVGEDRGLGEAAVYPGAREPAGSGTLPSFAADTVTGGRCGPRSGGASGPRS